MDTVDTVQSKKVKVGELVVHYLTCGEGEPLVVIHGGNGGSTSWKRNMEELAGNYRIYIPDLPGFGHSQPLAGEYYIPELVDFIDGFSDSLGLDKFHLMGHSLGGAIALSYALKFPQKITKLVLVSSMSLGRDIAFWVRMLSFPALCRSIGRAVISVLKAVKWVADLVLAPVEFILPISPASIRLGSMVTTFEQQTTVLMHRLSEIVMPTLIVWGDRDPILPVKHAYAAAQLIPDCRVEVFGDCGHSVYRERVPEFSQILSGFLGG
jgi:pimeloyl-ACP methyl ester carboxylesterase